MAAFEEMGIMPEIGKALEEKCWELPTDVQAEAIPLILGGGDVLMAAETGSGKTGAFCLPLIQIVWETVKSIKEGKSSTDVVAASGEKWKLSVHDRNDAIAVSPDGYRCQSREQTEWNGCRATKGVCNSGKYYFETNIKDEGLCRVGWSTSRASLNLGTDAFGYGFGGTGKKSCCRQFDTYGEPFGKNDSIGCLLDLDQFTVSFTKNEQHLGLAFHIDPNMRKEVFYPAVVLKNADIAFNFDAKDFKYPPPSQYVAVSAAEQKNVKDNPNKCSKPLTLIANAPHAIIIEPSRELAEQTYEQIQQFKTYLDAPNIRELLVIGGTSVKDQISALHGGVNIVVGTPGRMEDLISSNDLLLSQVRFFVLDEADGLLKAGYEGFINRMHQKIPKITPDFKRLQMVVCSATLHDFEIKKLAEKLMHFPTWVDLKGEDAVPETVHHVVLPIDPRKDNLWHELRREVQTDGVHYEDNVRPGNSSPETFSEATKILKFHYCLQAIDKLKMDQAIIFCRTKVDCDNLEKYLIHKGGKSRKYSCVCLHGDRKPNERKANLQAFKDRKIRFLICTDVAARGIDISGLPFMINVTLPDEKSNYVHRIGRVGRAERMGLAISLVSTVPEKVWYHGQWCKTRGRNCNNTSLTDVKGCCTWYDEMKYLGDIEQHLLVTIPQIDSNLEIPMNELDGKVVYGERKVEQDVSGKYHLAETASSLQRLTELEILSQKFYLNRYIKPQASEIK